MLPDEITLSCSGGIVLVVDVDSVDKEQTNVLYIHAKWVALNC